MTANFASGTVWTGDNLAVMRGMNDACVDLIYLDPPFNSNRHYEAPIGSRAAGAAFKDAWTLDEAQFPNRRHGLAIAASRQALGDGWSPSSMRWNHLR